MLTWIWNCLIRHKWPTFGRMSRGGEQSGGPPYPNVFKPGRWLNQPQQFSLMWWIFLLAPCSVQRIGFVSCITRVRQDNGLTDQCGIVLETETWCSAGLERKHNSAKKLRLGGGIALQSHCAPLCSTNRWNVHVVLQSHCRSGNRLQFDLIRQRVRKSSSARPLEGEWQ